MQFSRNGIGNENKTRGFVQRQIFVLRKDIILYIPNTNHLFFVMSTLEIANA